MKPREFQEIAHTGGKVTFIVKTEDGKRKFAVRWQHNAPNPASVIAVYALQGVVVADIEVRGLGQAWNAPPFPNCMPVMVGSDSTGKFGRQCPLCDGYWRSEAGALVCPYCAYQADPAHRHEFLTSAQRLYVQRYCDRLLEALTGQADQAEYEIDMNAVAAAVGTESEKPPFYYAEEAQQNSFTCETCGFFNDVLGRYCYCSGCGTRNDLREMDVDLAAIRKRINETDQHNKCIVEVVSAFDTLAAQYARQLTARVPMRSKRRARIERMRFNTLETAAAELKEVFDIDILAGIKPEDVEFGKLMFHRRHVYEHNGGEVDEKYLRDSGDKTVRLKQVIRETREDAHRVASLVAKLAANLHEGFHDIFPPIAEMIERHEQWKKYQRAQNPAPAAAKSA